MSVRASVCKFEIGIFVNQFWAWTVESFQSATGLKDQALVGRPLRLGGFSLQTQVFQCVVEVFVDLLRFLAGLQVGKIFSDLLDKLV